MIMAVHSSVDDYMDWDISKQEGVEGWVMFAVTHLLHCHFLITCYCACATIPISAQVPLLVSYPMTDCLKLLTFSTLTRFKGV